MPFARSRGPGRDSTLPHASTRPNDLLQGVLVGIGLMLVVGGVVVAVVGVPGGAGPGAPAADAGNASGSPAETTVPTLAASTTTDAATTTARSDGTTTAANGTATASTTETPATTTRRTTTATTGTTTASSARRTATTTTPRTATTTSTARRTATTTTRTATTTATRTADGSNGTVVYRVNVGGPWLPSTDGGPAWTADTAEHPSQYGNARTSVSYVGNTTDPVSTTAAVPPGTPTSLFRSWRWDEDEPGNATDDVEMRWSFPVEAGTRYEVRLYFAENYLTASGPNSSAREGPRRFDVYVEGTRVVDDYNIYADVGHDRGTIKSVTVTARDGTLEVYFRHVVENPTLNGIEVVRVQRDDRAGGGGESSGDDGGSGDGDDDDSGGGDGYDLAGPA